MTKSADTWMPLYVGKYMGATGHLTTEQHGAYFLLLLSAWKRGGWLPDDDSQLASTCKLTPAIWRRYRPILIEFFEVAEGRWTQDRVVTERAKAERVSAARSEAGKLGGRPRKQTESTEKPIGFSEQKQTETPPQPPTPDGVKKDADASSVGSAKPMPTAREPWLKDAEFMAAWAACTEQGRTRSSRKASWAIWRKSPADPKAKLAALKAYLAKDPDVKRTGGPGFHLWLRDKLEEWLTAGDQPEVEPFNWPGPADIWSAVVARKGEEWARGYLGKTEPRGRTLYTISATIERGLRTEVGRDLSDLGVTLIIGKAAA